MYDCPRCHFSTNRRSSLIDHLHRKNPCEALYSEEDPDVIAETYVIPRPYSCTECDKAFAHPSGLYRHKKEHTPPSSNDDADANDHAQDDHSHNNVNAIGTLNIATLVNINVFGKESLDHIDEDLDFLKSCLFNEVLSNAIPNIVEKIYFNQAVPENRNVKIKREHHPALMEVKTVAGWEEKSMDAVVYHMIDKSNRALIRYNDKLYNLILQPTLEESEDQDRRTRKLNEVKYRKKGVYGPIKSGVLAKVRAHKHDIMAL